MSILEEYRKQLEEDREKEDTLFPEGSNLTEDDKEEYEKVLADLRNNSNDMENQYKRKMEEMAHFTEKELSTLNCIKDETVTTVVKRAYCTECGEELISDAPPMFNPFTYEKICKHVCKKCGKQFNLEFAYPRVAYMDNNGNEIPAFGR